MATQDGRGDPLRVYGGVAGDQRLHERQQRLLEAGLELLAGEAAPRG